MGVDVWVDGSCRGNPGPGGCAALLIYGKYRKEVLVESWLLLTREWNFVLP